MSALGLTQYAFYFIVLCLCIKPLGHYIARVYQGGIHFLKPLEQGIYRCCLIDESKVMGWVEYALAMILFNALGLLFVYLILRFQSSLPLNPEHWPNLSPAKAFHIAVSFTTNTNFQIYAGEITLSYLSQMLVCTTQNFLSAGTGMAICVALIRGLSHKEESGVGHFFVDLTRSVLYILLPLSLLFALILCSQGVIQNLKPYQAVTGLQENAPTVKLPMGPVASQVAIKQLGSNGGGFFKASGAHPFENPTPFTHFLSMLAILLLPASFCYAFGVMSKYQKHAVALIICLFFIIIPSSLIALNIEAHSYHEIAAITGGEQGNLEGKEQRFGIAPSVLWTVLSTATANGASNLNLDALMPATTVIPLSMMALGETAFGGVGTGLYNLLIYVLVTVFVAGLILGQSPNYMGKQIEAFDMKMMAVVLLTAPTLALLGTAFIAHSEAQTRLHTAHHFTQWLYALTSMANNNGSGFSDLELNTTMEYLLTAFVMLIGRYVPAISILALAGGFSKRKPVALSARVLNLHSPLFISLVFVMLIACALTYLPAISLGPLVEHFHLWGQYGH